MKKLTSIFTGIIMQTFNSFIAITLLMVCLKVVLPSEFYGQSIEISDERVSVGVQNNSSSVITTGDFTIWGTNLRHFQDIPENLGNMIQFSAGADHILFLKADSTLIAYGRNVEGQTTIPDGLNNVIAISAGWKHNLALLSDGSVVAWGLNQNGQIDVPANLIDVVAVAAGGTNSVALRKDGTVVDWGLSNNIPIPSGLSNVIAIAAGHQHKLALHENGSVACWGWNTRGQCNVPEGLTNVIAISAYGNRSMALLKDGSIIQWGHQIQDYEIPAGLNDVIAISVGHGHHSALKKDKTVVVWPLILEQLEPPANLKNVTAIDTGVNYNIAKSSKARLDEIIVNSNSDNPHDSSDLTNCDTGELIEIDGEELPECTLRAAIQTANARGGATIHFDIPGEPLISVEDVDDPLPPFESRIILDGTTQAGGFVELTGPLQIFNATDIGSNIDWAGLYIKQGGGGSEIRGMVIHNFPLANLKIGSGANNTIIENNRIGTDFSGTAAMGGGAPSCVIGGGRLSTSTLGGCEPIELWGFPFEIGAGLHIMSSDNLIKDNVIAGNMLLRSDGDLYAGSVQVLIDYMAHRNRLLNNSIGIGNGGNLISIPSEPHVEDTNVRGIYILGSNNIIGGAPDAANRIGGHHIDMWIFNSAEELLRFDGGSGPSVPGPEGVWPTGNVISHNIFGISSSFATFNDDQKEIYASDQSVWIFGQQNRFENNEMATHRHALSVGGESNTATENQIKAWDMELSNSSMWDLLVGSIDGAVIVTGKNHQVKQNTIESGEWGIQVTGTGKDLDISENVIQYDEGGILISNVSRFEDFEDFRLKGSTFNNNDIETGGYGILITDGKDATFKANNIRASGAGIVLPAIEGFERHNSLSSAGWQRALLTQNHIDSPVGIDLKGDGVSLRHLFIGENGPNRMLNYPVIAQAVRSGNTLQFEGWFDHSVFGIKEYTIEVFGNTGCAVNMYTYGSTYGAGQEYLGSHYITPSASALGRSELSFTLGDLKDEHRYVTATVSVADEFITSEFSMCLPISNPGKTATADVDPDETGLLLADVGVTVSVGEGSAKQNSTAGSLHNGGTLFVTRYDERSELNEFGSNSALSGSGNQVTPKELAHGYWMINKLGFGVPEGSNPVEFEVCLDPAGIVHENDLNNSVIVQRSELSEGLWNPLNSTEKVFDGIRYLCAAGITEFSDFSIAAEELTDIGRPVPEDDPTLPTSIALYQNFPNPFNPTTQIRYELPQAGQVRLDAFDITGRHVATLVDGQAAAGRHTVTFDARNLSSGVYIYRLQAGGTVISRRLTLIK